MGPIKVEIATPEDWPAIQEIFLEAGRKAWGEIFPAEALEKLAAPARVQDAIVDPDQRVWVASRDGVANGFIVVRKSRDEDAQPTTAEIDLFYTRPSQWGQGFGQALMREAVAYLREAGYREVTAWTEVRNYRPGAFYGRSAFVPDGTPKERIALGVSIKEFRYRRKL